MAVDKAVAITGVGMVTAQGCGVEESWRGIVGGADRLASWRGVGRDHALGKLKVAQCGALGRPGDLPERLWGRLSRTQQLACLAADEALGQAGLGRRLGASEQFRSGLFVATTVCGMDVSERFYAEYRRDRAGADSELMRRIGPAEMESLLMRRHRLGAPGLRNTCLTTCVGSAMALGTAMDAINLGECEVALAGGSEALCRVVLSGFNSLKVVAAEGCRPFDKDRPGITVGEGAGMLVVESAEHAERRGAKVLAYLRGFGATCDAHHITAPEPEGREAARAVELALGRAGVRAEEIDYVNAHGTGTRDNDAMEARAIRRIFGGRPGGGLPAVSSTKRATGHTFGAAGAIEAIVCVEAILRGVIPPNGGSVEADAGLFSEEDPVQRVAAGREVRHAVSTNFAFGGNNTALVFSCERGK